MPVPFVVIVISNLPSEFISLLQSLPGRMSRGATIAKNSYEHRSVIMVFMPVKPEEGEGPDFNRVAAAWEKWEDWLEPSYRTFNEILLKSARIEEAKKVLDLGCGSGYPAILEAQRVGGHGSVIGLDISEQMLKVAKRRAKTMGLTNVQFQYCDVDALPFSGNYFDCATARFCLMFVRSPRDTLQEVLRVLKSGGRFSASVWGSPEKNPLPRKILERYYDLPREDPKVAGPYRFAKKGVLVQMIKEAGFQEPREQEIAVNEVFLSGQQYVDHLLEASALWGSLLLKLDRAKLKEATEELILSAEEFRAGGEVHIPRFALIVSASKE
jgi:enediyne biosynthesis protein CalE5